MSSGLLPDVSANQFAPTRSVLAYLSEAIKSPDEPVDVSRVLDQVQDLLDETVAANPYIIQERRSPYEAEDSLAGRVDLHAIDWAAIAERFGSGKKRTEVEKLRAIVKAKVEELARLNPTRGEGWSGSRH